jgi:hypothetical protein
VFEIPFVELDAEENSAIQHLFQNIKTNWNGKILPQRK